MAQRMSPNILKIRFSNTYFSCENEQKTRFDASMVFNLTHLRIYGRKIISRHFQLVRIPYQKLDFHGISGFSDVFIINNLNAWRFKSGTMNTKSLFRLSFNRSDKKTRNISIGLFRNLFFVSLTLTANFIIHDVCLNT
jgi:hypothetical protein